MLNKFKVAFDNVGQLYAPGSLVTGNLLVDANRPIRNVHEITASCIGETSVELTVGQSADNTTTYSRKHESFRDDKTLLRSKSLNTQLSKGLHLFPFSFQLPHDIPPSFRYRGKGSGHVRYAIQGAIRRRFFAANFDVEKEFVVENDVNIQALNGLSFDIQDPFSGHRCENQCCWSRTDAPMQVEVHPNEAITLFKTVHL